MTISFYNQNAQNFYDGTVKVDTEALYEKLLPVLPNASHLMDAGCGSGRDSLAFLKRGFRVTAFDASEELAVLAQKLTGLPVKVCRFNEFKSDCEFDGVWACASLLHVPKRQLAATFSHLAGFMKSTGFFYCSFKYGTGEEEKAGRHFTNLDENGLENILSETDLQIKEHWVSSDLRSGRESEKWLNALLVFKK